MIKGIRKLLSYSAYRRTIYIYAVSIILMTIGILICVFGVVSSTVKRITVDTSEQLLTQMVDMANEVYGNIGNVLSAIASDSNTMKVLQSKEESKEDGYKLFLSLQDMKSYYSYIENISVVNLDNDVCIHTLGSDQKLKQDTIITVREMAESGRRILSREIQLYDKTEHIISFFQYFPHFNGGILIDVRSDLFQYNLSRENMENRMTYVIDMDGGAVTGITRGMLQDDIIIAEYLFDIVSQLEEGTNSGNFDDRENNQIVLMAKSQNLGWWFCDIQEYSYFYREYWTMSMYFISVAVAFLVVISIVLVLFSKKMRRPLEEIANRCRSIVGMEEQPTEDELSIIDKTMAKISHQRYVNERYIETDFLKNMIVGQDMTFYLSKEKAQVLQVTYQSAHYDVLLIRITTKKELPPEHQKEEYDLYRFTICNLAEEIFEENYSIKAVDLGGDLTAILFMLDRNEISEDYILCYDKLKEFVEEYMDISITGSMGCIVDSQEDIYLSYEKARQYMQMSNLIGKNELMDSNQMSMVNYREKNQRLVESVIEYTKQNYTNTDLSLKGIAQIYHISSAYLGKIFKTVQGCSYASYLTNFRLEEAKSLLMETNKSVNEIASELGFSNTTYFTTLFKNAYGMTPTTFRNNRR